MSRAVALFSGGRGAASIAKGFLRTPGVGLSLLINGYDNGRSTGALRRYLPGMLGPSDFRKNLLLHLDRRDPRQAALHAVLEHRLPPGTTRHDLRELVGSLADPAAPGPFAALPCRARAAIVRELTALLGHLDGRPGLDLADCALGNLVFAGAYLRRGRGLQRRRAGVRADLRLARGDPQRHQRRERLPRRGQGERPGAGRRGRHRRPAGRRADHRPVPGARDAHPGAPARAGGPARRPGGAGLARAAARSRRPAGLARRCGTPT